jgi:hypothetical protein
MALELTKMLKFGTAFNKYFWLRATIFLSLLLTVWQIRFPFVFRRIYAEDGALFLSDALELKFPRDLFEPAAGYSTLIMRLGGRFVSLFPLADAAMAGAIFSAICLSFLAAGLFQFNNFSKENYWGKLLLTLSFLFLPLSSFSAVGNIANLYIYFMTASAVLLYYHERTTSELIYKSFVLFIAALSLPLTIFLLPIMFHRIYLEKQGTRSWKILKSDLFFILGVILQLTFILITSFAERVPHLPQSLSKVVYLYFDRGIGISLIPKWGFISGSSANAFYENSSSLLLSTNTRLAIVMSLVILAILAYFKNYALISQVTRNQILLIAFLGFGYSVLIGLFFNPEPRYMIFTSFLTIWVILLLHEPMKNEKLKTTFSGYLILVLIFGLTASTHRSQGPDWKPELTKAQKICETSEDVRFVFIRTLPLDAKWEVKISCRNLGR